MYKFLKSTGNLTGEKYVWKKLEKVNTAESCFQPVFHEEAVGASA